tara:strand:+ start:943 stop:1125 length:183 start_codon:yes stop_codon:yes gene_type:complete
MELSLRKFPKKDHLMLSYALPILNIDMPHVGHVPFVAGLPFFIVTAWVPFISLLSLHFTQ